MRGLSGIGAAIALALAGAAMPISDITTPGAAMFNRRDFSRSRWGTRSNRRYFHDGIPMRKAQRKGVPGVPRGHGDKRAICFSR